tara:strand:- start:772 stop:1629 length:858 start_codon:yes stop_codon:yes gene_type:complete
MSYKITIVMPVFNGEKTILNAINSLKFQTFKDWHCIIINDGSTDGTKNILDSISDNRFRVVNFKINKGRSIARQTALEMIESTYMCMLDADDYYYPHKLDMQFNFMENNPEITLMSTTWSIVNEDNELYSVVSFAKNVVKYKYNQYANYSQVPHASSIIRVSDIGSVKYNINLRYAEDTDFMRRLLINKNYVVVNDLTYVYNRDRSFSLEKYINSVNQLLKAFYLLPVSKFEKAEEYIKQKIKICLVFMLIKAGGLKWYMSRMGRTPNMSETHEFDKIKKEIFRV